MGDIPKTGVDWQGANPVPISFKPVSKPTIGHNSYEGFHPNRKDLLKKGHSKKQWDDQDGKKLECDIIRDNDVEIVMRDGTKLYADIYRPADAKGKIPCILAYGPYGKKYNMAGIAVHLPWKLGLRPDDTSGYETFESVDPKDFCAWGYAVANVDSRGTGHSEGFICIMGEQEAQDGYDVVEFLGHQDWCNGNVGMAGNSHLAITQYFIAAKNPPCLKAIAPWEGCSDLGREQFTRGGIFSISNNNFITKFTVRGTNGYEDFEEMYARYPISSAYWEDKRAALEKIKCAAFITGTDFAAMHTMGSIRAYMQIDSENKWIKWNAWQEWFDLWAVEESRLELRKFFDRYLKEEVNDWEQTPKVRWAVLQYGDKPPIENIALPDFPHPETKFTTYYLGDKILSLSPVNTESTHSYDSESSERIKFETTFSAPTTLLGPPKIYLHMSCADHDDMNVYVQCRKFDKNGHPLIHVQIPRERWQIASTYDLSEPQTTNGALYFKGPVGMLRASQRKIDRNKTLHPHIPFHPHDEVQRVPKGEVVELEIGIWSGATHFEAGETLSVQIFGSISLNPELEHLNRPRPAAEKNHGKHHVHVGGKYESRIILPIVDLGL
jgi:predicted acyl esterase